MNNGYIALHRKILDWGWYTDSNVKVLFIHLLLKANHEDSMWQGTAVKRGQAITGRFVLAKELGLSERMIRTALTKLKSTNEIAITTTNRFSLITLVNYEVYQPSATNRLTNRLTNKRPTNDQQTTTNNKDNKNNKEEISNKNILSLEDYLELATQFNVTTENVKKTYERLKDYVLSTGKVYKDYKATVRNWIRSGIEDGKIKQLKETKVFNISDLSEKEREVYEATKRN